jgi:hypothetical protein
MRTVLRTVAFAVVASLALAVPARADVQLTLRNGRVTLIAKDATVRQILAEWARVGKTKIVNAERVPGGPMTIELRDVPAAEALDVLLRSLSGYMAAPRTTATPADASVFDSIAVMPTVASTAPRTSAPSAPAPFSPPPVFNQNEEEPQENAPRPAPGVQPVRPPIFSTFPAPQQGSPVANPARPMLPVVRPGAVGQPQGIIPQPQNSNPNEAVLPPPAPPPAAPSAAPGGFAGTSAPGMMPPAAPQTNPGIQSRPNN